MLFRSTGAFLEAIISNYYGVKSKDLKNGYSKILNDFKENPKIGEINFYEMLKEFEEFFTNPSQETCGTHS